MGKLVGLLVLLSVICGSCGPDREPDARPDTSSAAPPPRPGAAAEAAAAWQAQVPAGTRQVVRTVSSNRFCHRPQCAVTQAWSLGDGRWLLVRELPSTIGARGWGKAHADDGRSPVGVFTIKVTFSTTRENPGRMPWRRRLPTSTVSDADGPSYNTWIEEPGRTDGDRRSMSYGFVLDYNHVRLRPGVGPAPVPGAGSGIFFHTSRRGRPWEPSDGCVRVSDPQDLRWLLGWLRPGLRPRVVLNL